MSEAKVIHWRVEVDAQSAISATVGVLNQNCYSEFSAPAVEGELIHEWLGRAVSAARAECPRLQTPDFLSALDRSTIKIQEAKDGQEDQAQGPE